MKDEKVLICYDTRRNKVFVEKIMDTQDEYENKSILYCSKDITAIVCFYTDHYSIKEYTRLLLKEINKEQVKDIISLNKQLCEANRIYINTVNKLID